MAEGTPSSIGDFSFPPCFLTPTKALVILTGLDTRNNAVHSAIWHLFTSGRSGEALKPVIYKTVTADHIYPRDHSVRLAIIKWEGTVQDGLLARVIFGEFVSGKYMYMYMLL